MTIILEKLTVCKHSARCLVSDIPFLYLLITNAPFPYKERGIYNVFILHEKQCLISFINLRK